jgi:ATP-dependent DNA helicase RecG
VAFPYAAMEEAIVNAIYHRSYDKRDSGATEPVKIYLYPDRMEIISYPGPVHGIQPEHFEEGRRLPPVPHRNRLIGNFLKELRLAEGRNTGIPKIQKTMRENGSPAPIFDFDAERTYFRVTLAAHPKYVALNISRECAHLWTIGERNSALAKIQLATQQYPTSGLLYAQLIEYAGVLQPIVQTEQLFETARSGAHTMTEQARVLVAMAQVYINHQLPSKAIELLSRIEQNEPTISPKDIASMRRKAGDLKGAHATFTTIKEGIWHEDRYLHEFADVKLKLAKELRRNTPRNKESYDRLLRESIELYRRTIQLSTDWPRCTTGSATHQPR